MVANLSLLDEIELELEALYEKNASPIYRNIKNTPLLGRCRVEIRRLYTENALLAEENVGLLLVIEQGLAMIKASRTARQSPSMENMRLRRKAENDFEKAIEIALMREVA
jgi:hypothetical protein